MNSEKLHLCSHMIHLLTYVNRKSFFSLCSDNKNATGLCGFTARFVWPLILNLLPIISNRSSFCGYTIFLINDSSVMFGETMQLVLFEPLALEGSTAGCFILAAMCDYPVCSWPTCGYKPAQCDVLNLQESQIRYCKRIKIICNNSSGGSELTLTACLPKFGPCDHMQLNISNYLPYLLRLFFFSEDIPWAFV